MWTRQPVSHAGLALWLRFGRESDDKLCVLECMEPGGMRVVPLELAISESSATYWQRLDWSRVNGHEAIGWALDQWGARYASWSRFLAFVSPRLFGGMGEGLHCSELVASALMFGGHAPLKPPALVTPGDLHSFACLGKPVEIQGPSSLVGSTPGGYTQK